jgi:DNA-binding NtrC family response regulator
VVVPPLRNRREDIPELVQHFLDLHGRAATLQVAPGASEALVAYDWPGNVRQLSRVLERAIALAPGPEITLQELPEAIVPGVPQITQRVAEADDTLRGCSSRHVRSVLERCRGNKRRACHILDISYHTLQAHLDYNAHRRRNGKSPEIPPLSLMGSSATAQWRTETA